MNAEFAMTAFYIVCCIASGWIGYWIRVAQEQAKDQRLADLDRYWHERKAQLREPAGVLFPDVQS